MVTGQDYDSMVRILEQEGDHLVDSVNEAVCLISTVLMDTEYDVHSQVHHTAPVPSQGQQAHDAEVISGPPSQPKLGTSRPTRKT